MDLLISFLGILAIISMYAVVLLMVMRSVEKNLEKLRLSIKEDMRHLEESLKHSLNRLETNLSNHMKGIGDRLSQRVNKIKKDARASFFWSL